VEVTNHPSDDAGPELTTLVREIVHDSEVLIGQQFHLLRSELQEEWGQAREAVVAFGAGAGLVAVGGAFSALAIVHALHKGTRLPLWSCYGLIGGLLGAAGAGLLAAGRERAADLRLPPPQSMEALRENLEWLKEQVS